MGYRTYYERLNDRGSVYLSNAMQVKKLRLKDLRVPLNSKLNENEWTDTGQQFPKCD